MYVGGWEGKEENSMTRNDNERKEKKRNDKKRKEKKKEIRRPQNLWKGIHRLWWIQFWNL